MIVLILAMTSVSVFAVSLALVLLYNAAFEQQRARLVEAATGQARLMEAVARFDAEHSTEDHPQGAKGATLSQIEEAFKRHGDYQGSEQFVLAERQRDKIVFILSQSLESSEIPEPVPFDGKRAEPMRLALLGQSGTVVGPDFKRETVLAAYEPVAVLDMGLVAKIDVAEIRAPFVRAGATTAGAVIIAVVAGVDFILSKPVAIAALRKAIVSVLKG